MRDLLQYRRLFGHIDWILFFSVVPIVIFGLITMYSFSGDNTFFTRHIIWFGISLLAFFVLSTIDFRFLRRTSVIMWLFLITCGLLLALFIFGSQFQGSQSWFNLGFLAFQPSEPAKIVLILLLAKYFSRRHVEIKNVRHIIVSGVYAGIFALLVLIQPDFGSAIIIAAIWFGMVLASGLSRKHLMALVFSAIAIFALMWTSVFEDYQKDRIISFVRPLEDVQGTGYNAYQAKIAVGSGEMTGKGIGYGTQSRLLFLPEYQTDFIFAAFAEEWGFIGALLLLIFYAIIIWRILANAQTGSSNFEVLYGIGLAILIMGHIIIHVGMNIGLMPVTGITIPFMSYGGTNLLTMFSAIGILMGMRKYSLAAHKDVVKNEIPGL